MKIVFEALKAAIAQVESDAKAKFDAVTAELTQAQADLVDAQSQVDTLTAQLKPN